MLYSCTRMATVGVKAFLTYIVSCMTSVAERVPVACVCQVTTHMLWTLYCLARSADVQDALYRDTVAVLAATGGHVTPDTLQRLHNVRACIKETSRSCRSPRVVAARFISHPTVFSVHFGLCIFYEL